MGRPPSNGAPSFRFHPSEVAQMEAILQKHEGHVPPRDFLVALAQRFSESPERSGKIVVQMKQIWNWFQNKRYALRAKSVKSVGKSTTSPVTRDEVTPVRNIPLFPQSMALSSGALVVRNTSEASFMEFEAKSSRDGAWYDVQEFLSHRYIETGNPEVLVRFSGFGPDEDEWRNIRKHVRQRSLPCEAPECIAVLSGDLILCFQEGKEQALYFDALVLDAQRRRHDVRGCRCRFLVRFYHDQSEEIVPLRKICRRPETDYRLQQHHAANAAAALTSVSVEPPVHVVGQTNKTFFGITNSNPSTAPVTLIPEALISTSVEPPVHVAGQANKSTFGITSRDPSTAPVTLIPAASTSVSVEPPVHVVAQTNKSTFGITSRNPSTAPVTLIPAASTSVFVEPPVHVVGQTNNSIFGITSRNPSSASVTLIPAASTSVSVEPPVHVVAQTNNSIFGISSRNPSTSPVTLIPTASTSASVEPPVHVIGQTSNSTLGITNPNPGTATLFPSPVLRISRSARPLFGPSAPSTSPIGPPAQNVPPGFTPLSTSVVNRTPISTSVQAPAVTVPVPPGFTPLSTSVVTQSPISTSVQAPAVTVPVPPGFTPLSTSVVTQSPISTSVQAPVGTLPVPPAALRVSTAVTVPVFPASLTASTQISAPVSSLITGISASFPEQNNVRSDYPAQFPVHRLKIETDSPALLPEDNKIETDNRVSVFKPIKVENDYPAPIPEPNKVERVNLAASNDEASAHAKFTIPAEVRTVIEAKKAENSKPETTALTGSNVPDGHPSDNPTILVSGQEKAESNSTTEKLKE